MRVSKAFFGLFAIVALLMAPADSFGHRIYFSTDPPPVTADPFSFPPTAPGHVQNTRPEITLTVGGDPALALGRLEVWLNMDNPLPTRIMNSVALDIEASAPGVAQELNYVTINYDNIDAGDQRWDNTLITAQGGPTQWVTDGRGFGVSSPRVSNSNSTHDFDQGHDDITGDFHIATLDFRGVAPGVIGLYFRVGAFKMVVSGQTTHPIQFGHNNDTYQGTTVGAGDIITADLANADAIIRVVSVAPTRDILKRTNEADTNPDRDIPGPTGGTPLDIPYHSAEGTLIARQWRDSFFDVFFDIEQGDPNVAMSLLQAQANNTTDAEGYQVIATPGRRLNPGGPEYEFMVRFPGQTPGADQTLDFDFGSSGIVVGHLGIPEPSSIVLTAMGLVGLAFYGARRRRAG